MSVDKLCQKNNFILEVRRRMPILPLKSLRPLMHFVWHKGKFFSFNAATERKVTHVVLITMTSIVCFINKTCVTYLDWYYSLWSMYSEPSLKQVSWIPKDVLDS